MNNKRMTLKSLVNLQSTMILYFLFIFILNCVTANIMYIDAKRHISGKTNTEYTEDKNSPLPLSSFFAQSDTYQCLVENNGDKDCLKNKHTERKKVDEKIYYGPTFQKVHLALPVREQHEVGFIETISFNNREMTITTLSRSPQIYEIKNFFSENETELIIDYANYKGLKPAITPKTMLYMPEVISERIFDQWDEDFDGHLSIEEIYKIMELNPLLLSEKDLTEIIIRSKIDKDENGYISFGELSIGGLEAFNIALKDYDQVRRDFLVKGVSETRVWHDEDELLAYEGLLEDFHERLREITNIPTDLLEQSEPLQVTKYETNAASYCQLDSMILSEKPCCVYGGTNCRVCRYATILVFLNDVESGGEIVFPLADNATFSWENLKKDTIKKCEKTPNPATSNVVIKPQRGKAIMWYNHVVSPVTGWLHQMNPQSLVGITPIQDGNLWTAKFWININGDGVNDLRPWKMGNNWLDGINKNENLIDKLRNDYFIEREQYIHQYRKSYKYVSEKVHHTYDQMPEEQKQMPESANKNISIVKIIEQGSQDLQHINDEKDTGPCTQAIEGSFKHDNEQISDDKDATVETVTTQDSLNLSENIPKEFVSKVIEKDVGIPKSDEKLTESDLFKEYLPLGPPKRPVDPLNPYAGKIIENRLVRASLLILEELERDELEIIARSLHDKLQLACIPLIVNPIVP